MPIPPDIVARVREASDIVEVISRFVPLKKQGRRFVALCPFHSEKAPSFSVSPDKQLYYCFGCQAGGNVISFLMAHEKMEFTEAVKYLADSAGIKIPEKRETQKETERKAELWQANNLVLDYFSRCLRNERVGKLARGYLAKRGIDKKAVDAFSIGYAPDMWDGLIKYAKIKKFDLKILEEAHLLQRSEKSGDLFDFFRGRLIFPIHAVSGKILGFGGRALKDDQQPKYLNSPESPIYQKRTVLYGLYQTKDNIEKKKVAILVEGYTDLVSLYQCGFDNIAAVSGTAFTLEQARLLSRFADEVFVLFDSDQAGSSAALRSVEHLFAAGLEVKLIALPAGEDPDSLIRGRGPKALEELLATPLSFFEFKERQFGKPFSELTMREQEEFLKEMADLASQIGGLDRRSLFVESLVQHFKLRDETVRGFLRRRKSTKEKAEEKVSERGEESIEVEFINLLVTRKDFIPEAKKTISPETFQEPGCREVLGSIYEASEEEGEISFQDIFELASDQRAKDAVLRSAHVDFGEVSPELLFEDYLRKFKSREISARLRKLKRAVEVAEKSGDAVKTNQLLRQYQKLKTDMAGWKPDQGVSGS
ncbi:MAG: DNA primase [Candidatus Zixiibacteriota bacterium]